MLASIEDNHLLEPDKRLGLVLRASTDQQREKVITTLGKILKVILCNDFNPYNFAIFQICFLTD